MRKAKQTESELWAFGAAPPASSAGSCSLPSTTAGAENATTNGTNKTGSSLVGNQHFSKVFFMIHMAFAEASHKMGSLLNYFFIKQGIQCIIETDKYWCSFSESLPKALMIRDICRRHRHHPDNIKESWSSAPGYSATQPRAPSNTWPEPVSGTPQSMA